MFGLDNMETWFVVTAFLFQIILIVHFALRKWRFHLAMHYGPIVYALSIPAAFISVLILLEGKPWYLWPGGFIYLIWAVFGYAVEYIKEIEWRISRRWSIFVPYVFLYLATVMFYWWPLGLIRRPLWYIYTLLFIVSTILNATSHKRPTAQIKPT